MSCPHRCPYRHLFHMCTTKNGRPIISIVIQQTLSSCWEDFPNSSNKPNAMSNNLTKLHQPNGGPQQHPPPMDISGIIGRSSVFALPLMRGDRPQLPAFGSSGLPVAPNTSSGRQSLSGLLGVGGYSASPGGDTAMKRVVSASNSGGTSSSAGSSVPSLSSAMNHGGVGSEHTSFDSWHRSGGGEVGRDGGGGRRRAFRNYIKVTEQQANDGFSSFFTIVEICACVSGMGMVSSERYIH